MKQLKPNIWVSVSAVAAVFIVLILLSAFTAWLSFRDINNRHNEGPLQASGFPDNAQSLILQMNSLLLVLEIQPELRDSLRPKFYQMAQALADEFANREYTNQETIFRIKADFEDYLQAAKAFIEAPLGKLVLEERLEGLRLIYQKAERPVLELEQLSLARGEKLATILGDYGFAHKKMVWLVFVLSSLSSVLVAAFAVIYLLNRVSHLRLERTELNLMRQKEENLVSLGVIASGVAHEIRNPLTAIKARLFALERRIAPESDARDQAREIGNEINRLEKIVKEVLLFARPPKPSTSAFEVGPLLEEVRELLTSELDSRDMRFKLSDFGNLWVMGDPEQCKQILINLIQNAADASKAGDEILVRTRAAEEGEARVGRIAIDVVDQGSGLTQEDAEKLFAPFYTTKPKGTGLGLSISKSLAQMQNGDISFSSQDGRGSTFTLCLPRAK